MRSSPSIHLCISAILPSFQRTREIRKNTSTLIHPPLSPMELKTFYHSHLNLPQLKGFSLVSYKEWVHKGPSGFRDFIDSKRYPKQQQQLETTPGKANLITSPSWPCPPLTTLTLLLPIVSLGVRSRMAFSTKIALTSTPAVLTFLLLP